MLTKGILSTNCLGSIYFLLFFNSRLKRRTLMKSWTPQPQAIVVLGGHPDREKAAAQLAKYYPALEVWVSSGSESAVIHSIFQEANVSAERLHLDY